MKKDVKVDNCVYNGKQKLIPDIKMFKTFKMFMDPIRECVTSMKIKNGKNPAKNTSGWIKLFDDYI